MNSNELFTLHILNKAIQSLDGIRFNPIDKDEIQEAKLIQLFLGSIVDYINSIEMLSDKQIEQLISRIKFFLNLRGREIGHRGYTFLPYTLVNQVCVELASNLFPATEVVCNLLPDAKIVSGEHEWDYTLDNQGVFQPQNYLLLANASLLELPVFIDYVDRNTDYLLSQTTDNVYGLIDEDRKLIRGCAGNSSQHYYDALETIHQNKSLTFLGALEEFGKLLFNSSKGALGLTASQQDLRDEKADLEILEPVFEGFFQTWIKLPQSVHLKIDDLRLPNRYGMTLKLLMTHTFTLLNMHAKAPEWCTDDDLRDACAAKIINCTESISRFVREYCTHYNKEFFEIKLDLSKAKEEANIDDLSKQFKNALSNPEKRQLANPHCLSAYYLPALACLGKINAASFSTIFSQQDFNEMVGFFKYNFNLLCDMDELSAIPLCCERIKQLLEANSHINLVDLMQELNPLQLKVFLGHLKQEILSTLDCSEFIHFIISFEENYRERGIVRFIIKTHNDLLFFVTKMNQNRQYNDNLFGLLKFQLNELITSGSELITILSLVPVNSRDLLIHYLIDSDIFPLNKACLYTLLPLISVVSQEKVLMKTDLTRFITDLQGLMDLSRQVKVIPGYSIKQLAEIISSFILTFENLIDILKCTNSLGREVIINILLARIPNLVTRGCDLIKLIILLDAPEQILVLNKLGLSLLDTYQLFSLLTITEVYALPIINQLEKLDIPDDAIDFDNLRSVLARDTITVYEKIRLVGYLTDILKISLKNKDNLLLFLSAFPSSDRSIFLESHIPERYISDYEGFLTLLKFHISTRKEIINEPRVYIQYVCSFDNLKDVFDLVNDPCKIQILEYLGDKLSEIITNSDQCRWLINSFTSLEFGNSIKADTLNSLINTITAMQLSLEQLVNLLVDFNYAHRTPLIIQLGVKILPIITDVTSLFSVLTLLDRDGQASFLTTLAAKLPIIFTRNIDLLDMVKQLSPHSALKIINLLGAHCGTMIANFVDLSYIYSAGEQHSRCSILWAILERIKLDEHIITEHTLLPLLELIVPNNYYKFIHLVDKQTLKNSMTTKALVKLLEELEPKGHLDLVIIVGSEKTLSLLSQVKHPSPELKVKINALKYCVIKPAKKAEKIVRKATEGQIFPDQKNEVTEIFRYYAKPSIFRHHHHKKEVKECLNISPDRMIEDCETTARNTAKRRGTFFSLVRLVKIQYGYDLESNKP